MKTVFILTYYILLQTRVTNTDLIQSKHEVWPSYDAALASYNLAAREKTLILPNIFKSEIVDTLKSDSMSMRADIIYSDSTEVR